VKEEIKQFVLKQGAHAFGIADAGDFIEAPIGFKPKDIMPSAQSVIVLGKAIPKGAMLSANKCVYTLQGEITVHELDVLANKTAHFIEEYGDKAMPIPTDAPYFHWEEDRKYGMGILSHRHAAVKAGLGTIGKNGLLIHPSYGSCITLVSILTDLKLEKDIPIQNELCPPNCKRCLEKCPAKALEGNKIVRQMLCRSHVATTSLRGHELVNCWNCRMVCPSNL